MKRNEGQTKPKCLLDCMSKSCKIKALEVGPFEWSGIFLCIPMRCAETNSGFVEWAKEGPKGKGHGQNLERRQELLELGKEHRHQGVECRQ